MVEYVGTDFFTYHMVVGTTLTAPATVAIRVVDPDNPTAGDPADRRSKRKTRKLFERRKSQQDTSSNVETSDIETGASPRRPPWRVNSNSGLSKPRESELNTIEMENIYSNRPKSNDRTGSTSPFIENLMRKTSGSAVSRKSAEGDSDN